MPLDRIAINQGSNKDTEEVGLATGNTAYLDCVVDDQGVIRRRPGLELLCNVGHRPIDGIVDWPGQDVLVASSNAKAFTVERDGTDTDVTGAGLPTAGQPISFVEYTPSQAYMATGGRIISLDAAGTTSYIADANAPTSVSHIAAIDFYLLAVKDGTDEVYWPDVGDPTTWNNEFITAEGKPDILLAVHELNKLGYLFGKKTLQTIRDDGVTPFVPEYQGYVSRGLAGKYACILCPYDNRFYFLDNTRMVVRLDGLSITPVSASLNRYISSFSAVSDVRTSYAQVDGRPYLIFYFPTEQKTLVLDVKNQDGFWSEWNKWDNISNEYSPFIGGATSVYVDRWGSSYVGDRITGNIYRMSHDVYQDNGTIIRSAVRTARINKGTETRRKFCHAITLRMKKLRSYTGTAPVITLRYRDNGAEEWTAERQIPVYQQGGEYKTTVRALGSYYSRQWEIACSDNCPFELASMEEEWS